MKHILIISFTLSIFGNTLFGKITLPSVFADNMVLQQNSEVAIWGWSEPGETVRIVTSWNSKDTVHVKANNYSRWETNIRTISAGGPYSIEILGSSDILLNNAMLGEVWICSGQSNMEWSANMGITNGEEEIAKANYPNIRIFHVQRMGAEYPQQDCHANWTVCTPETMRATSAIGYFYGRKLHENLDVPIGLIVSAWGGTPVEVWIEEPLVENNPEYDSAKYSQITDWWPSKPGATYNSMIAPLVPYGIAGAIWYQGESNCNTYQVYSSLKKTLIESWRSDFKKDFPFYFVQIAPFDYGIEGKSEFLREQQEMVTEIVPNTGMVVISDLVDDIKDIHPKNKLDVGKRLAVFALAETYKQNVGSYKSPTYESMKIEKKKIQLFFNNVPTRLECTGKSSVKFMIAGEDQKFVEASAKIEGNKIVVSSKLVKNPLAVRYCFDDISTPDVFTYEGLPLAPFRTDKW